MKRALGIAGCIAAMTSAHVAHADASAAHEPGAAPRRTPLPDVSLGYSSPERHPTLAWALLQLVPSPELAVGTQRHVDETGAVSHAPRTAFGLRWQVTPVLWSFGASRHQSRWRTFVVDPIARQSGSLELSTSFEYIGGHVDRLLARPGLRVVLPALQRGEYLSVSLGTSVYSYEGLRVAYDVGAYLLGGFVGFQVTIAPAHAPLTAIGTLCLRYF